MEFEPTYTLKQSKSLWKIFRAGPNKVQDILSSIGMCVCGVCVCVCGGGGGVPVQFCDSKIFLLIPTQNNHSLVGYWFG